MSIAGHVSAGMLAHYSHVRLNAKRNALEGLSDGPQSDGHVTNDVTNTSPQDAHELQVVEKMVDVTGIEPATPCLQRLVARRINNLHGLPQITTERYKCNIAEEISATP